MNIYFTVASVEWQTFLSATFSKAVWEFEKKKIEKQKTIKPTWFDNGSFFSEALAK